MGVVIVTNMILIMIEADRDALCYPEYAETFSECPERSAASPWIFSLNMLLLVIYSTECCLRFFVERSLYCCNAWNMIDLTTVIAGWLSNALASVVNLNLLRLARLVRVVRAVRVFISIPEFYLLMSGLYSSIKAILFGSLMLVSVLIFWAILAVELFNPITSTIEFPTSCERCPRGFASVTAAGLTLFQQIVAGDSWGEISVPLIEKAPWTGPILYIVIISISLGVMNLILAVIVERATEARDNDHENRIKKKELERSKSMVDLAVLCATMDKNSNGLVSLEEMIYGYDHLEAFRKLMKQMDIKRDEMQSIFNVLDSDNSGEVSYLEFCSNLGGFQKRDPVIMHSIVHCAVMEVRKLIQDQVLETMQSHHEEIMRAQNQLLQHAGLEPVKSSTEPHRISLRGQAKQHAFAAGRKSPVPREESDLRCDRSMFESLAKMEKELQPLLEQAEVIVASLADTATDQGIATIAGPVQRGDAIVIREGAQEGVDVDAFDLRFQNLLLGFQEQQQRAEFMQQRLRDVLNRLDPFSEPQGRERASPPDDFHRKMFHV
eukprot:Skav217466  [mRNA]  locus=scaffold1405:113110:114759:- [translate_table: standard]